MKKIAVVGLGIVMLSGCFEPSPYQKIQSDTYYSDLTIEYWANQSEMKTALWKQAKAFCHEHRSKPNCGPIFEIGLFTNGSTKIPGYGTSGESLQIPDIGKHG